MSATSETRNWDAVVSSTLEASKGDLMDNIHKGVKPLAYLKEADKIWTPDGGQRIKADLMYGKNTTVGSKGGYDLLDTTPQDGITSAFFDWKEIAGTLVISRKERRQNSGKHQMFDLIQAKRKQLEMSFVEEFMRQLLSDGTGNGSKDLDGFQIAIKDTPTTVTYGGINPANETWWRNQYDNTGGVFSAVGLDQIRKLYRLCARGNGDNTGPDLMLCEGVLYDAFEAEHVLHLQFVPSGKMNENLANLGIENFKFKRATVMEEEQMDSSGRIYMINTNFAGLAIDKESNFKLEPAVTPSDQTATVAPMICMANWYTNNRRKQGVLTGLTAS